MNEDIPYGYHIDKTLKRIQASYLKAFTDQGINLTIEQWVILQRIYELGDNASQSEITKTNYRNRATTSRVISGLAAKNLITKARFDGDSKRYKLNITKQGQKVVHKVIPIVNQLRTVGYKNIEENESKIFLEVLDKISQNFED